MVKVKNIDQTSFLQTARILCSDKPYYKNHSTAENYYQDEKKNIRGRWQHCNVLDRRHATSCHCRDITGSIFDLSRRPPLHVPEINQVSGVGAVPLKRPRGIHDIVVNGAVEMMSYFDCAADTDA